MKQRLVILSLSALVLALAGCAGTISPQSVREELVRQSGGAPAKEFELILGRVSTALLKTAIGPGPDGALPLQGLTAIELAIYGLPPGSAADALDFSGITPYGWENVVRYRESGRSALVMIRTGRDSIHDLALVVAGGGEVVYGRVRGNLPPTLPIAIRDAMASGGTAAVKQQLLDAAGEKEQ